jgi:hypothetical protein
MSYGCLSQITDFGFFFIFFLFVRKSLESFLAVGKSRIEVDIEAYEDSVDAIVFQVPSAESSRSESSNKKDLRV